MAEASSQRMVDVALRYLKAEDCRVVFGIPGGLLHPFFEAVENDGDLTLIVTKHEEGAAFMADGYARTTRRIAVCAGTSGPGTTNLLTGVSAAYADGVPMLIITGQAPSQSLGKGASQETAPEDIDAAAIFRSVTKYSTMITEPERFAHHFRRAMRRALADRPGPVHLNIPVDFWNKPTTEQWFDPATYRAATYTYDRAQVECAADVLSRAVRPVILVGSGVAGSGAEEEVVALAEILPAVAATTPRGKGVFPEDHPLSLGVLGFAGHAAAREVVLGDEVDVLFTVGASLNETTTYNWDPRIQPRQMLIQLDIDSERIGRNYPVDIPLVGDARTIVAELVDQLRRAWHDGRHFASQWGSLAGAELRSRGGDEPARSSDAVPITPQRWRADLEEVLPDDALVYSDIGGHMLFNIHDLHLRAQQRFVLNLGFGSMGHGTAAPIGAALASPGRPVVAIIGDACFTMNGMEILTAVEYRIPVIWIVENNQRHGITWHGSRVVGGKSMRSIVYRHPIDVMAMARAMGVAAWRVERPGQIQAVLREAIAAGGPALIEVCVDPEVAPPLADRAKTVAGFSK